MAFSLIFLLMRRVLPRWSGWRRICLAACCWSAVPSSTWAQAAHRPRLEVPGAEATTYRGSDAEALNLYVFKPAGWTAADRRTALVFFFGGAWQRGSPDRAAGWARLAASWGLVGIAPDYRTKERFGTSPVEAVADARAAVRWVQEHAAELGIDAERVVVGGNSAGGHLALWTGIAEAPYGSDPAESPLCRPAALILMSAPSDTTAPSLVHRFGPRMGDLSPLHHLDPQMPPVLMFHGTADRVVDYRQAEALHAKLTAQGNGCEFVTVPEGSHGFSTELPEWRERSRAKVKAFLEQHGLLPSR